MDHETEFLTGLIELQYGLDVVEKLKLLAADIAWAKGWPENSSAFWNAEAFMWNHKISKEMRELIAAELSKLKGGRNLDLGCGGYSYIPSVGFDFSEKMLVANDNCVEKIKGDLEKKLPFADSSFDSATAIFVLNYIDHFQQFLQEVARVLIPEGRFMAVFSAEKINDWQRQKEVRFLAPQMWKEYMKDADFFVEFFEKGKLHFFYCRKNR